MTKDVEQNWHRNSSTVANELTVRLGEPFAEICLWAVERELELPLEVGYRILGLDPFTVGIGNLVKELSHPESKLITSEWEANPVVYELQKFTQAVTTDTNISRKYASISHLGGVRKNRSQFKIYPTKTFLLTLVTNPLADTTAEITYTDRRRLRIWLLIQAASRLLEFGYSADKSISNAARFLVIDATDDNWTLIDDLLKRARGQLGSIPNTYERFTTALANASHFIKNDSVSLGKTATQFLNAINTVANGECREIEASATDSGRSTRFKPLMPTIVDRFFGKDLEDDSIPIISPSDEGSLFYFTDVDPTDSAAQQIVSSGSVYIQTMELSHYLPWSWERVLPVESKILKEWLHTQLHSTDTVDRTGGALVWLAMHLSRSLVLIERMSIESKLTDEWSFSNDFHLLKRTSPRRRSSWRPDESVRQQVNAFRDDLTVSVPQLIRDILQTAASNAVESPQIVGRLWQAVSSQKLDTWFNEQARKHFPRLTSAKLANYQSQQLFDATGEFHFSRLLTSHPSSALPGGCSYADWDIKAIEKGLQLPVVESASDESDSKNIMGSLLTPVESVLTEEIERCNASLQQAFGKGLIQQHNALAQYVVMALYAATGARPLRDPFESAQHFSLQYRCVFINDKNDEGLHNGRLVPLPEGVITLLTYYLDFLSQLGQQIATHRTELALQISNLTDGREASVPLFFLLDDNLRWHSMSDAAQLDCLLFEWLLPANLFRHRYSQRLLKEGVDPEVIDGWMGHAERGAATYSDYSIRCWETDAVNYQAALERAYSVLPFATPAEMQELPPLLYLPIKDTDYSEPKVFGQKERARFRWRRIKTAIREARADIKLFLNNRKIQDIGDNDLLLLSTRMLLRENRLPHPMAAIRFNIFIKMLQKSEATSRQAVSGIAKRRLFSKRLVAVRDERTLITPSITRALELYTQLFTWATATRKKVLKSGLSKGRALCVGSLLMAVEKRLGYKLLLEDVAAGQNFRLLQNQRCYFLEYSELLDADDFSTAVQRHEISYKVASLIAHGVHQKKIVDTPQPSQINELKALLEIYSLDNPASCDPKMEELLSWLCNIVNQANLVQLPGILAAALSERAPPTSSSLRDYERLLNDRVLDLPAHFTETSEWPSHVMPKTRDKAPDKQSLQGQAKEFSKSIATALQAYVPAQARQCAKNIRSICDGYHGQVSSSMLLLGYWIADLAASGKAKKRKNLVPYALNSLSTYLSSLSPAFRDLLYEVDLVAQDSEEITELCAQMLDYKNQSSRHADYFGKRLKDFFRWAARFGVASPEWTELDLESGYRTVSPGLISESEYQTCIETVLSDNTLTQDEQLILGFVLLTSYRFGLRAKEAVGMLRRDWCQHGRHSWVLVQSNQYRTLKSKASRRAIPLLFKLSEGEQDIIDRTLGRYTSIAGKQNNRPVLCEASGDNNGQPVLTSLEPRISGALIRLLRSVTGNPLLVLHHCRHSFYNRISCALFDLQNPLAEKLSSASENDSIRCTILGPNNQPSRRSAVAIARLMGHKFPSTGLKNYFHLATEWADQLTPVIHTRAHKIVSVLQVFEQATVLKTRVQNIADTLNYPNLTLMKALQVLRLVSLGMGYERAGELMQVRPLHISRLQGIIFQTNARMRFSSKADKNIKIKGEDFPNALLESLSDGAWQRLLHRAEELKDANVCEANEEPISLDELPCLISPNRHILMEQPAHYSLIRRVVELFEIPNKQYQFVVKNNRPIAQQRMAAAGFKVVTEHEAEVRLDGFTMFIWERNSQYRLDDYGGLVLTRSASGVIRNSYELVIAVLAVGFLMQLVSKSGA
ncbi:hypothetical protein [Denitrificimonas caeni]|uniref:hypothetical protein n=1 Tax=Denitrificimonas caeni TaxID=521720 RepID=UPI001965F4F4|nr:hypothetical protein [Denitrificimonas caeni]